MNRSTQRGRRGRMIYLRGQETEEPRAGRMKKMREGGTTSSGSSGAPDAGAVLPLLRHSRRRSRPPAAPAQVDVELLAVGEKIPAPPHTDPTSAHKKVTFSSRSLAQVARERKMRLVRGARGRGRL